jgi:hypothetical protein
VDYLSILLSFQDFLSFIHYFLNFIKYPTLHFFCQFNVTHHRIFHHFNVTLLIIIFLDLNEYFLWLIQNCQMDLCLYFTYLGFYLILFLYLNLNLIFQFIINLIQEKIYKRVILASHDHGKKLFFLSYLIQFSQN